MSFIWDTVDKDYGPSIGNIVIDVIIIFLIYAFLFFIFIKAIKRKSGYFLLNCCYAFC